MVQVVWIPALERVSDAQSASGFPRGGSRVDIGHEFYRPYLSSPHEQ